MLAPHEGKIHIQRREFFKPFHPALSSAALLIADRDKKKKTHLVRAGTPLCNDMKLFLRLRCVRSWL